ncbi:MAG: hypothetical protein ACRDG4_18640 [Chloroflexota bacterium]
MYVPRWIGSRAGRSLLGRMALAVGLAAIGTGALTNTHAHAAFMACRSDPVLLVNGALVDVVSTLNTAPSNIRELDYTITVPSGALLSVVRLTIGIGFPEKVTYVYSPTQPRGSMQVAATVQTAAGVAPFATSVRVTSLLVGTTASGYSNSTVVATLGHLLML